MSEKLAGIKINADLHRELKVVAVQNGEMIKDWIEVACRARLNALYSEAKAFSGRMNRKVTK